MANNLATLYTEGKSMPQLREGVYNVTLTKHALVQTNPANPYIALEFTCVDTGRVLKENRFNNGFQIMVSHLKQQLDRGDEEVGYMEFLNSLMATKEYVDESINETIPATPATPFKIWVTKYTPANGGQTRSNFNFLEPRKKTDNDSDTGISVTKATDQSTDNEVEDAI